MYSQAKKPEENKNRAGTNLMTQRKKSGKKGFGFIDNVPSQLAQYETKTAESDVKEKNTMQYQKSIVIQLDKMTEHQIIQKALDIFVNNWTADAVNQNVRGAYNDLSGLLRNLGIRYGDNAGSRRNFPNVHGLHIGEILDMLHTLHMFLDDAAGFKPQKFWDKLLTMREMMEEIANE